MSLKLRGMRTKYILKKAAGGLLPRAIVHRRKAGFMMPLSQWFKTDLKPWIADLCAESEIRKGGLFEPDAVRHVLNEHQQSVRDHRKMIWPILCFQAWRRQTGHA